MTKLEAQLFENIRPLKQEERLQARQNAREHVKALAGNRPTRERYVGHTISEYPMAMAYIIIGLCIFALLAAFTPSAIRLYDIGSETFGNAIDHEISKHVVGIAVVILAEISQLVFSLSLAVLGTSRTSRRLLYFGMVVATLIALVGNIQVALPGHWDNPFAWLEAVAPPVLVLSLAYVLKEQMLKMIQTRHANEVAYQKALREFDELTARPEEHPDWKLYYANSLKDALTTANQRKRNVDVNSIPIDSWRMLVSREMRAENWFSYVESTATEPGKPSAEVSTSSSAPFERVLQANGGSPT